MKASKAIPGLPLPVRRALRKLGHDLSTARRRRRLSMATVAERALVSRNTLTRAERGDPGVSMGIYATILFVLGLAERVGELAAASGDPLGLALDEEHLPKRVRSKRRPEITP